MRNAAVLLVALLLVAGCMGDDGGDADPAAKAVRGYMLAAPPSDERIPRDVAIPDASEFDVVRDGDWAVPAVELDSEFGAYAAAARREGGEWKVRPPIQRLRIVEGPPEPGGAVGFDQRVGFGVYSSERDLVARLWIDGKRYELAGAGGRDFTRYWATPRDLASGRHIAVVLARGGADAAAVAWAFTAP